MSHYPESHLSTLSHSLMRMSREQLSQIKAEREAALIKTLQSTCIEERYQYGLPHQGKKA